MKKLAPTKPKSTCTMSTDGLCPLAAEVGLDGGAVDEAIDEAVDDPLVLSVVPVALVHWTSEGMVKSFDRVKSAH